MPLKSGSGSKVVSGNIRELHKGKTYAHTAAKFGKKDADRQAVAIALSKAAGKNEGGGVANRNFGGGFEMQKAPHLDVPWQERSAMRSMTRGALLTATPGRADAHRTNVPSGSYVIPADVVSGRGQGNTLAGAAVLGKMFGMGPYGSSGSGPYGGGAPKLKMGKPPAMPKPPKPVSIMASGGGKEGDGIGSPVPVNLSGGEVVVPPEHLVATFRRIFPGKNYTLKQIHQMMDQWVLAERAAHRKTLAKLPKPARD